MAPKKIAGDEQQRYGIGEWFGHYFPNLSPEKRRELAAAALKPIKQANQPCPFMMARCNKKGGVCSMLIYTQDRDGKVTVSPHPNNTLVTLCPKRFYDLAVIFREIGKHLLGVDSPVVLKEVPFLKSSDEQKTKAVGKIDNILAYQDPGGNLHWCALEMQAVYFSGAKMGPDFHALQTETSPIPFPVGKRRPDFRSSGPKRLMPQLQTKIPTLRRWGKKMAVVMDTQFFDQLGPMSGVKHPSSADILWFVVDYKTDQAQARLYLKKIEQMTLEEAVEGLTGGEPVPLPDFEEQIRKKLVEHTAVNGGKKTSGHWPTPKEK